MRPTLHGLRRRAQSRAILAVRRSRFFPQSMIDRLGDDAAYADRRLDARVIVFFPGPPDQLYQLLPWLPTLEAVDAALGVAVVCQDSRVAEAIRERTTVQVVTFARYGALDGVIGRSDVALALYVGHASANFECLRFASLLHAYIGHGDSDKGVSASNQLKAYDAVLAPGQAAVDRIVARLMRFDAERRCIVVGQPTTLSAPPQAAPSPGGRTTVLYAPTWEGAQPSVAYSSVLTHGPRLVEALLADGRYRVLYRPHPLTGVTSGDYAGANAAIRTAVEQAGQDHRVLAATDEPLEASFARADVLVCDVSAVATAWMPSLRPLVVTAPAGGASVSADSGMLARVRRLVPDEAADAPAVLAAELADEGGRAVLEELVAYYLSPYWPDRSAERFVAVCGELVAERDRLRAALVAAGATGT
ncbi:CDP-glycerol glycerophosphotransferase family protein [Amnibacterium kyonggiense]|uniref:CDP-glycerol:poly(Glycerophosphate) glycerophosphotransferase n=1 Tax=Amnibacterium kyonggiense TaxID=595671 RepID=A0A4R7FLT1_9MICO|nr:CDP-glycerol glycerophosphotransferase family protein [Amnibacterium kyonggiense]TDS77392.1 CDP-glycerol:poly(glycerophosphate) glycerophosphotransferase [Amnibacterium kyonggiense]